MLSHTRQFETTARREQNAGAEIEGRSVSEFVVNAARHAAERTIEETQIIRLSLADQQRVAAILASAPPTSPGLDRAMEAHRTLIREGE